MQIYKQRRLNLLSQLSSGVAIIPNSFEQKRSNDTHYNYRFDSYFYYLTGFDESESLLVLDAINKKSILFCKSKDPLRELWDGKRYGLELAKEQFLFDEVYDIGLVHQELYKLITNTKQLYYTLSHIEYYDKIILDILVKLRKNIRNGLEIPVQIIDINHLIAEKRLIKDATEISLLQKAADISIDAYISVMQSIKNIDYEYQVEAKFLECFVKNGARSPAYSPIIASGANACILHYSNNNVAFTKNGLILIDAGAEYMGYAADITRTFPVNGSFSKEQREIYEIVLEAQRAAMKAVKPGNDFLEPNREAMIVLAQGLERLGILPTTAEEALKEENQFYKRYSLHNVSHMLGLDVHDCAQARAENYKWGKLEAGMVLTVEPGLYFQIDDLTVPAKYRGIGVRIEDDVLVTPKGCKNLSAHIPTEVSEIESWIKKLWKK